MESVLFFNKGENDVAQANVAMLSVVCTENNRLKKKSSDFFPKHVRKEVET